MEVEILKSEKNEIEVKLDNLTVVEVLRVYLNEQGAEFAAWKREHISENPILKVESSGKNAKKEISDAVAAIKKDLNKISALVKK